MGIGFQLLVGLMAVPPVYQGFVGLVIVDPYLLPVVPVVEPYLPEMGVVDPYLLPVPVPVDHLLVVVEVVG